MERKMINHIVENKTIFVGLEDSKRTWKIAIRCEGNVIHQTSMPADFSQLMNYFSNKFPKCTIHVLYEAGFKGFTLHDQLAKEGIKCYVVPPHLVSEPKVNKVKTDKRDARRLAMILENNDFSSCHVPDRERREDRQISRTLEALKEDANRCKNRIWKFFDFHGLQVPFTNTSICAESIAKLKAMSLSSSLKIACEAMISELEMIVKLRESLKKELKKISEKERYVSTFKIIQSMPGIGWYTAIRMVLELGEDLHRFSSGKKFASFFGLTSSEHSTGETRRQGSITHIGSGYLRTWLLQSAWVAIRKDEAMTNKFLRIKSNTGSMRKAIVAIARSLAVRMRACVVAGVEYQNAVAM